jgi:hypothetical protein
MNENQGGWVVMVEINTKHNTNTSTKASERLDKIDLIHRRLRHSPSSRTEGEIQDERTKHTMVSTVNEWGKKQ